MAEETVEVELTLPKMMADRFARMSKKELTERLIEAVLENHVRGQQTHKAINERDEFKTKLDVAESYVEQARAMINAIMERWYEYDV